MNGKIGLSGKSLFSYLGDLFYGASMYPCGWIRPKVFKGYFANTNNGIYQKIFFDRLLAIGFRRTYWQLVFPGQTAGLVKTKTLKNNGVDEYHIRFYDDGIIDCELEVNRFNGWHWDGPRQHGISLLHEILEKEIANISYKTKKEISSLFGTKNYSDYCVRK